MSAHPGGLLSAGAARGTHRSAAGAAQRVGPSLLGAATPVLRRASYVMPRGSCGWRDRAQVFAFFRTRPDLRTLAAGITFRLRRLLSSTRRPDRLPTGRGIRCSGGRRSRGGIRPRLSLTNSAGPIAVGCTHTFAANAAARASACGGLPVRWVAGRRLVMRGEPDLRSGGGCGIRIRLKRTYRGSRNQRGDRGRRRRASQ
jgi:hypothetical protein